MNVKYSINTFIEELVERDTKKRKNSKRLDKIKQNKKDRYQRSLDRSLIMNYVYTQSYIVALLIGLLVSLAALTGFPNMFNKATFEVGTTEAIVPIAGLIFFLVAFFIYLVSFLISLPKFIENTANFLKNRGYLNAIGKQPNQVFWSIRTNKEKLNFEMQLVEKNPLNAYVVNEDESVAYRLYEFVDLNQSTVDNFAFIIPNHLKIQNEDFEPCATCEVVSNQISFEAIADFVYRAHQDIKEIEHKRYKSAVANLPMHQQNSKAAVLIDDLNK